MDAFRLLVGVLKTASLPTLFVVTLWIAFLMLRDEEGHFKGKHKFLAAILILRVSCIAIVFIVLGISFYFSIKINQQKPQDKISPKATIVK